jgi:alpha-L-fucosidase 2
MMQSYSGTIWLFPNTRNLGLACFQNLRAVGAFLVNAAWDGSKVSNVTILSERGVECRMALPTRPENVVVTRTSDGKRIAIQRIDTDIIFKTTPGEQYRLTT